MDSGNLFRTRAGPAVALKHTALALAVTAAAAAAGARSSWLAAQPPSALASALAAALALALLAAKAGRVSPIFPAKAWILDHAAWRPPADWFLSGEAWVAAVRASGYFSEDAAVLMEKVLSNSGLGKVTAFSPGILRMRTPGYRPTFADCLSETERILFDVTADVLSKSGTRPDQVDVVITSCSCFAPTPSMAAMIVNKFKMRKDVLTYSMAGLGCSSSLVCVDLAKHLLKALPKSRILVVNHENISNNWYIGEDKSMLVVNCLFRAGGAAAVMTNIPSHQNKYEVFDTERTHLGREDPAFLCMGNGEDSAGNMGVFLRKNVIETAGAAMRANLTRLAPRVLPLAELAKCAADAHYVPNFKTGFDSFLLHTGGRGVLDALQKSLSLSDADLSSPRATLARFGNTSAASIWYILAHHEHARGVRVGQRFLALSFGGGFKACAAALRATRPVSERHACWDPYHDVPGVA